jgi:serine/threonine protein kinase
MSWPEAADYDLVVQNPSLSFIDSELAGGHAQQNLMGFPKSFSGNFAIVYVIETWLSVKAVKCFIKEHSEQYRRYEAISECLARLQSPYFVEFEYILNGIKLKGGQYPVLKMDWVSGDLLYSYIEKNIADSAKLMFLAERWREMAVSLHRSGIAHGDLQHGNVIIHNEQIKLIDYDGMYVHALANLKATESGVRHFQHPSRSDQFGPYLDNFSHWIIYTTLVALSLDPSLWSKFNNDEPEFLLRPY